MEFGTLITAMVTPFDERLQVNWQQVEKLIDYLIEEQHNDSLVISGTTGESPTLTDEEKIRLFEVAVRHARGRCKIIAGTGSNDTAHSIHLTQLAEKAGVDGILLVTPYYNRPSQEAIYQHGKAVAESTTLPVMLYNVPARSGVYTEPETTLRLAQIPNIVSTKEAHINLEDITQVIQGAPEGFRVYCGEDSYTLPYLAIGAYGIVSVAAHVIGKEMKEMIEAYGRGEVKEAARKHTKLSAVFKGMFNCPHRVPSPAPVKHALRIKGMDVGGLRMPLLGVTEEEGRFIEALFET